jgi:uncharacterized protein (UPF0276 family)
VGFTSDPDRGGRVAPRVRSFFESFGAGLSHAFFSWQPRDRARIRLLEYAPAWDDLMAALPPDLPRALHQTSLDLASLGGDYRRGEIFDFTNALCERYRIAWINEDVGFWSLAGKPLPYPLPPLLDAGGLAACVRNVRACQRALVTPLLIEFPGFAAGVSLVLGDIDAYDFFRTLADETGAGVTLDLGHLLSWRWWQGHRGARLFDDLDRLPLGACFEIHLSGCAIAGERFVDAHHGVLLDEQLTLLDRLLPLCPRLRAITFEDPRIDADGALCSSNRDGWSRLAATVERWAAGA